MRALLLSAVVLMLAGCAPLSEYEREQREYQRVDYYESVYLPATRACDRAGGFMILEDATHRGMRGDLSYPDMRLAVVRGCAGI